MSSIIIFPKVKFWIEENEILHCQFENHDSSHKLSVSNVLEYIKAILELTEGVPMPFLIDLRNTKGTFEHKAAKLLATHPELIKLKLAEAYVSNSMNMRLLILSYKRLYDPNTPYQIFKSDTPALQYCLEAKKTINAIN